MCLYRIHVCVDIHTLLNTQDNTFQRGHFFKNLSYTGHPKKAEACSLEVVVLNLNYAGRKHMVAFTNPDACTVPEASEISVSEGEPLASTIVKAPRR